MNNTISVKNKYTRLFFTCMAVCCGLIWTFTNLGYDGEYQLAMCRRLLQGDKLFLEMWEPHQTSSFLPAFLMWIYISLLGTTTGIVVYLQACGILIRGGISLLLYRTLGRDLTENAAFGIALLFFMISPKDYALPEFSNLQLWFSTLLFCCLWTYLKTGRKYLLAVSALWLSLLVLAYPSCAIVLFGVILLLALYSPYKKRDILLVSGICAILGTAAGGYFLCTVGPENLKACLSGMLALEPTHTEGFFARLSVYGSDLLIQGFLLAAAGVVVLPPLVIVRRKRGSRCSGLGIWLLAVCGVLLAGFFFNILSARNRFAYSIILLFAAGLGFLCRKNLNGREKQIYFCGSVIGGLCFLATLMLSDLPLPVSVPYGLLLAGVSLIPIEKQASKSADTIIIRGLPLCYACFVLLLAFRCVYIRTPLSGKAQICPSVGSSMSLVRSGPALGLISNEDGVCIQRDSYPEWKKWIRPGDKVWIIGGVVDTLGYLYEDVEIAGPSTISTPYYSEAVLSYWKLNPDKYPDVIVAEGYLGTLSHELQTNQWLMDWLAQEYRPAQIIEGKFWNYYFKTSRETEDGQ